MTESIAQWRLVASGLNNDVPGRMLHTSKHRGNELELLEQTCHAMAQRLSRQFVELESADKRRRRFLTSLSHDLRTPLTSVTGALETVIGKSKSLSTDERNRFLMVAYRQSSRLHRLIEQVFELARLDSGDLALTMEPVSVQELVMDTAQEFAPHALKKGVALRFDPACNEADYRVNADLGQLNRVLINLLSNAIQHTPQGGSVSLSTLRHLRKGVVVTVTDSGCGFAGILVDYPLSQIDSSMYSANARSGTGLGLGIVSRILALHGTEAKVTSRPDKGTQVRFCLKAAVAA